MRKYILLIICLWSLTSISIYGQSKDEENLPEKQDSIEIINILPGEPITDDWGIPEESPVISPAIVGGPQLPIGVKGPDSPTTINVGTKSNAFIYNHTQDTKLTGNAYQGRTTKDIFYKLVLSTPMTIEVTHTSTEVTYTNAYLVQWPPDNYKVYATSTYPGNSSLLPNPGKARFTYTNLPAGTYYVISEGYSTNGKITTTIKGTLPEPKVYNITRRASPFTYTHTQNTNDTPNAYVGRSANDVFYKLQLLLPMDITMSHCGSEVSDTYLHVLDEDYNRIAYNDDYSGDNKCSNTRHSYLKLANLQPGYYYIVSEGYSANGNITTTVKGELPPPIVVKAGTKTSNFSYTHTQNTRNTVNAYMGNISNDIFYEFTITKNMDLEISMCGSEVTEASGRMYPGPAYFMEDETEERYCTNSACRSNDHIYRKYPNVSAGTYRVVSEGRTNGKVKTTIKGTVVNPIVFDVGSKSNNFTYNHTHNTFRTVNAYGKQPNDVFYKFTLQQPMEITINTGYSSRIYLLNSNQELIELKESATSTDRIAKITRNLQAGTYYAVSEKLAEDGAITTTITGTIKPFIVQAVTTSQDFHYTHTQDTRNTVNAYSGMPGRDVYYKIDISRPMDIVVSHCGSEVADTYVTLLDASFNRITYNDNHSGVGACSNTTQSYLKKTNLPIGTYYVVSEGKTQDGNITTTIEGYIKNTAFFIDPPAIQNYIETLTPLVRTTSISDLNYGNCTQLLNYFDGIGRPTITVQGGATPGGLHLTSLVEYDSFGRVEKQWLPAPIGVINYPESNLRMEIHRFHSDDYPYTLTEYKNSSLSQITATTGPGYTWHNQSKNISQAYLVNTISGILAVDKYEINSANSLVKNGTYPAGELYVEKVTDEDGNVSYTFTNQPGQLILERQLNGGEQINTYYVYDSFGNLSYVLPPMINGNVSTTHLNKYAYIYKYDERNRCIEKKLPGAEPDYHVYDNADRLILTQDGNMRTTNDWILTCYDSMGRIAYTLKITLTDTHSQLRNEWKSKIFVQNFSKGIKNRFNPGFLNSWKPSAVKQMLTVYYYDNYDFLETLSDQHKQRLDYTAKTGYDTKYANAKGLLTGTRIFDVRNQEIYTVNSYYYDIKGKEIQNSSLRVAEGAFEKNYYKLTFTGKTERHLKQNTTGNNNQITEIYSYTYDHQERLKKVTHQLNGGPHVALVQNTYNESGQLSSKTLHGDKQTINYKYNIRSWLTAISSKDFTQQLLYNNHFNGNISSTTWSASTERFIRKYNFTYDGLNRLKRAQYLEIENGLSWASPYYDIEIGGYDKNGNITKLTRYGMHTPYSYPRIPISCVSLANYTGIIDDLHLTYNGNQLLKVNDTAPFDPVYNGAMHFIDGVNSETEYTYDSNGNMVKDLNAGISSISYNLLNLPYQINISTDYGHKILNEYDAKGNKIRSSYFSDSRNITMVPTTAQANGEGGENTILPSSSSQDILVQTIDYHNNIIYKNDVLDKILLPEGYIDKDNNGKFVYHYYLRDHQGNNRVVINQNGVVEQVNHYYPFGGLFGGSMNISSDQPYKYGGKELERMFGYDAYDFHARSQMPMLGRFMSMDPMAEDYYNTSPYAYAMNNPLRFIDMTGMNATDTIASEETLDEVLILASERNGRPTGFWGEMERLLWGGSGWQYDKDGKPTSYVITGMPPGISKSPIASWKNLKSIGKSLKKLLTFGSGAKNISANIPKSLNKKISFQKQIRHVKGRAPSNKGYMDSHADAQKVLDAVHSGEAQYLGKSPAGHIVVKYTGVTGTNVNTGVGITNQPTNIFMIKGTVSPSVVPTSPIPSSNLIP